MLRRLSPIRPGDAWVDAFAARGAGLGTSHFRLQSSPTPQGRTVRGPRLPKAEEWIILEAQRTLRMVAATSVMPPGRLMLGPTP